MLQKFPRIHATDIYNNTENIDKYYCPGDDLADLISAAHHSRLSVGNLFPHSTSPYGRRGELDGDHSTTGPSDEGIASAAASFGLDSRRSKRRDEGCLVSHSRHVGVIGRGRKTPVLRSPTFLIGQASEQHCDDSSRRVQSDVAACPHDLAPQQVPLSQANGKGKHQLKEVPEHIYKSSPANQRKHEVYGDGDHLPGSLQVKKSKTDCAKHAEESEVASSENHQTLRPLKQLRGLHEASVLDDPAADMCQKRPSDNTIEQYEPNGGPPRHDNVCQEQDKRVSLLKAAAFNDHRKALERELLDFINLK